MSGLRSAEDHAGLNRAIERLQEQSRTHSSLGHWSLLARLLSRAERLAEANELYRSISMDADAPDALIIEAAACAEQVGDLEGAELALRSVLAERESEKIRTSLAQVVLSRGRWMEAAMMAWGLVCRDPENVEAWAVLAACGWVTGRRGIVEAGLEGLRREDPRGGASRLGACLARAVPALMEQEMGASEGVTERLRRWREVEAYRVEGGSSSWERLLVRTNRALLNEASQRPEHADAWYHLARVDMALGDRAGAIDGLSRALGINPKYRQAHASLEKVCRTRAA